jgi:hypothetical protein
VNDDSNPSSSLTSLLSLLCRTFNTTSLSEGDMPLIDEALQVVCSRLIASSSSSSSNSSSSSGTGDIAAWAPAQQETVRRGLVYLAQRVCAPRDMGSDSAAALRAVLLQL